MYSELRSLVMKEIHRFLICPQQKTFFIINCWVSKPYFCKYLPNGLVKEPDTCGCPEGYQLSFGECQQKSAMLFIGEHTIHALP